MLYQLSYTGLNGTVSEANKIRGAAKLSTTTLLPILNALTRQKVSSWVSETRIHLLRRISLPISEQSALRLSFLVLLNA